MLEIVSTSKILGPPEIGGPRLKPFSLMVNPRLPTCLCVKMEFVVGTIRFHVNCVHFLKLLSFM